MSSLRDIIAAEKAAAEEQALMNSAVASGSAPGDDDLAAALAESLRTLQVEESVASTDAAVPPVDDTGVCQLVVADLSLSAVP